MAKNETNLTVDLYENIINTLVNDVVKLKKEQGETISKISVEKEVLVTLKKQLKETKKEIRTARKSLRVGKSNLRNINSDLRTRKHSIAELNYSIGLEEPVVIDLDEYAINQPKRR